MDTEYVVINKTELLKRIEELEGKLLMLQDQYKECYRKANIGYTNVLLRERYPNWKERKLSCLNEIALLKRILSQSADLIPEVEKAFQQGVLFCQNPLENINLKKYIKNLNL